MEHAVYLNGIKRALKAREATYADLARHLKMTESGVKKMLNAKDISFRRVLQICEVLEVLPGQLFSLSEKTAIPVLRLTDVQQDALLKDRELLAVYWRFTIEKMKIEEISKDQSVSATEFKKVLQRLVALGLINHRRGRYFAKHQGKFRWSDDSRLAKTLNQEWSQTTLKRALQQKPEGAGIHRLVATKLSHAAYNSLLNKMSEVLDEAIHISEREELTIAKRDLHDFTALVAIVKGGVFESNGDTAKGL